MPHKKSKEGYLSVTEVLNVINKPFLCMWYGKYGTKECERIKKESQEIGIRIHRLIELRFNNTEPEEAYTEQEANMVGTFWTEFVDKYQVKPILLEPEEPLIDEELKLQGTLDAVIMTTKGVYIADWKTSNQLDKVSVPLQLCAYDHLYGHGIGKGVAVRIDKTKNKIETKWYENLNSYWPIFKNCLELAKYTKEGIKE